MGYLGLCFYSLLYVGLGYVGLCFYRFYKSGSPALNVGSFRTPGPGVVVIKSVKSCIVSALLMLSPHAQVLHLVFLSCDFPCIGLNFMYVPVRGWLRHHCASMFTVLQRMAQVGANLKTSAAICDCVFLSVYYISDWVILDCASIVFTILVFRH